MRLADSVGVSDPGRVRRRNEDAYVCEPPLFAVADGMGGAQAGELASRLAAAALREQRDDAAADPETHLRSSIQEANRRIFARAATDPQVSGMVPGSRPVPSQLPHASCRGICSLVSTPSAASSREISRS